MVSIILLEKTNTNVRREVNQKANVYKTNMSESTLFLIDANALCYRAYYAIKGLTTSKGQATNAVYGFINTLRKILREYNPKYAAICFDVGKKTHRQQKFAAYKIQRPPMPDDLVSQIPIIKEVVQAYNLPIFELEGFEADDVIATIAEQASQNDVDVVIVTDDKDMFQLVGDHVKVYSVRKDQLLDYAAVKEQLGINPESIVDFIALAGDQVDNIPGVKGIGEVTARNLIKEYGDLEGILKGLSTIKSEGIREKLSQQEDLAKVSKELAILDKRVPIRFDLKDMEIRTPNQNRLLTLFRDLEFRKFAEEMAAVEGSTPTLTAKNFKDAEDIAKVIALIKKEKEFTFLLEPPPEEEGQINFSSQMFMYVNLQVYSLPEDKIKVFKEVFEDQDILKITHNIKEVMKFLDEHGCRLQGKLFDVMLAGYLLTPALPNFDVSALAWQYLKTSIPPTNRFALEVELISKMYSLMLAEMKEKSLLKLFTEIEIPLAHVLFRMETSGVRLDEKLLEELSVETDKKIKTLECDIYKMADMTFNLNSPKQLSQVLFEKLKLPVVKKTKTGFSTDEGVLVKLAQDHKLPALLLEYRQLAKLKSTYIDALPRLVDLKTHRLHAYFNQTGAETGRLSSNNPNLQNIPIRSELGRQIRKAFIPSKGNVLIAADYSQIELRILAHLSGDEALRKAFQDDEDIHCYTAALIFEVKEKDVTPHMRDMAKRVNFGIIYGMSAFGLSKDLNIRVDEAQDFIEKYFLRYPKVKKFMDGEIKKCEELGFVATILGRRRYLPEIKSGNINIRQFAQRQAINTPVQGSAADLLKLVMINIQNELEARDLKSKMIITVHDELVFDAVKAEEKDLVELIRKQMEHPVELSVSVKVTIKTGPNWLETKEV